jgi:hypothetical protein
VAWPERGGRGRGKLPLAHGPWPLAAAVSPHLQHSALTPCERPGGDPGGRPALVGGDISAGQRKAAGALALVRLLPPPGPAPQLQQVPRSPPSQPPVCVFGAADGAACNVIYYIEVMAR